MYRRGEGETRKATGDELMEMVRRLRGATPEVDLAVNVLQGAVSFEVDDNLLETHLQRARNRLMWAYDNDRSPRHADPLDATTSIAPALVTQRPEPRTREQYLAEIDNWESRFRTGWQQFLDNVAAARAPSLAVTVVNRSNTYLEKVRLELRFEAAVRPILQEQLLVNEPDLMSTLPRPPRPWSPVSALDNFNQSLTLPDLWGPRVPMPLLGTEWFKDGEVTALSFDVGDLRPQRSVDVGEGDLTLLVGRAQKGPLTARWQMTAKGHHAVHDGACQIEVDTTEDWTSTVAALLASLDVE